MPHQSNSQMESSLRYGGTAILADRRTSYRDFVRLSVIVTCCLILLLLFPLLETLIGLLRYLFHLLRESSSPPPSSPTLIPSARTITSAKFYYQERWEFMIEY